MRNIFILFILLFLTTFTLTHAEEGGGSESIPDFNTAFRLGSEQYQAKKYSEALSSFNSALSFDKNNLAAINNAALTHFQLGHKGWAAALFRKSLEINPSFEASQQGLEYVLSQLQVKELPHDVHIWEVFRKNILSVTSLRVFLIFTAFTMLSSLWFLLAYISKRKKALLEEQLLPAMSLPTIFLTFVFLASLTISILKFADGLETRGTVVADKSFVRSLPQEDAAQLFEIFQGLEVIILRTSNDWYQIQYPGGSSGWIPKEHVFITTGK